MIFTWCFCLLGYIGTNHAVVDYFNFLQATFEIKNIY